MAEIEVTINKAGEATIAVKGVKGPSCLALTEGLEKSLGRVAGRTLTEEHQAKGVARQEVVQGG